MPRAAFRRQETVCGTQPLLALGPRVGSLLAMATLLQWSPGGTRVEVTQLNIESLWSGGPFADPVCRGYCTPNLFLLAVSCELMVVDV